MNPSRDDRSLGRNKTIDSIGATWRRCFAHRSYCNMGTPDGRHVHVRKKGSSNPLNSYMKSISHAAVHRSVVDPDKGLLSLRV
jgi:hypothetical protein